MRKALSKITNEKERIKQNDILDKSKEINEERERIQKKEELLNNNNDIRGAGGQQVPTVKW